LCYGGNAVAFSINFQTFVTDWQGNGPYYLCDGRLSDVWRDPETGYEWAIIHEATIETDSGYVVRHRIDKLEIADTIFGERKHIATNHMWYSVGSDGTKAVAQVPWPYIFYLESTKDLKVLSTTETSYGCWASMAKSAEGYYLHLKPFHDGFKLFKEREPMSEITPPIEFPPGDGKEVFHPRFASSGSHVIVFTAGYPGNTNSDSSELFIARFEQDYTNVCAWCRLTDDSLAQGACDAWVGVDLSRTFVAPQTRVDSLVDTVQREDSRITITSPREPVLLSKTDMITITWTATIDVPGVVISCSADLITWHILTDPSIQWDRQKWGTFTIACRTMLELVGKAAPEISVKVSSYNDANVNDISGTIIINENIQK
jgi:hypothetical protein